MPVKVVFSCDDLGVVSFKAQGHTGFAQKGSDIVCAAISAVIHNLAVGAQKVISNQGFIIKAWDGYFEISCKQGLDKSARRGFDILASSVIETLKQIEQENSGSCSVTKVSNFNVMMDLVINSQNLN